MIALDHLRIVQDAAKIEMALWDGKDPAVRAKILKSLLWVQDQLDELSLDNDLCDECLGTGIVDAKNCVWCEGHGYFEDWDNQ